MGCGTSVEQTSQNVTMPIKDQYIREQLIGVGNHGCVYKGIHHLNQKAYAVKVVNHLNLISRSIFRPELYPKTLSAYRAIKHRNVLEYQFAELSDTQLSLILEIAPGATLRKYIHKHGKSTEEFTSSTVLQILEGMLALHQAGILHKDLKSNNILMNSQQHVLVSDFGLAELYDSRLLPKDGKPKQIKKSTQFSRGFSLPYMAPEVILDHGCSQASDVWSIGCVAVQMLTGKVPWSGLGSFEVAFKKIKALAFPPFPAGLSKQAEDFLRCCLSVSPGKRWKVQALLRHPFINGVGNQSDLYFELSKQNITLQPQTGKSQRGGSQNSNRDGKEGILKTPGKGQKRYRPDANPNDRILSQSSRQTNKGMEHVKPFNNQSASRIVDQNATLCKDDILPQINESDEDVNMVTLNNRKVKMRTPRVSLRHNHVKTEPVQEQARNSMQLEESDIQESLELRGLGNKVDTEPNLMVSDADSSRDYFKKPLRLLKKKLQESRRKNNPHNNSNGSVSYTNQSSGRIQLDRSRVDQLNESKNFRSGSKIRSNTENSQEEIVINTSAAQAERNRYVNERMHMQRQRQEEKARWEEQLKSEAKSMRKEFAMRYAYPYRGIPQ